MKRRMILGGSFYSKIKLIAPLMIALLFCACNKDIDRILKADYGESGTDYKTGKVLMIIVDGAGGKAVQEAINTNKAPNIKTLVNNSMYTFEGLADSRATLPSISNERGWANLLTGVTIHGIGNTSENIEDLQTASLISRLKSSNNALRASLISSDATFANVFGKDADKKEIVQDDNAVKTALIDALSDHSSEPADVTLAHLQGVNKSGEAGGFYNSTGQPLPNIISSINTVDSQLGEIMNTLKARPNFVKENWLVVISSNYGGKYEENKEGTFYDDPERNTFTLFYSPRLVSSLFQPPAADALKYSFFTPYFSGQGQASISASVRDASLFNMGGRNVDKNSYTVQFHLWDNYYDFSNQSASGSQSIVGKRDKHNSGAGWQVLFSGTSVRATGNSTGNSTSSGNTVRLRNNPWRAVTVVFKEIKDSRYGDTMFVYIDGVPINKGVDMDANKEMSTDKPLTIGLLENGDTGARTRFSITNLQFYNAALPPAFIAANFCKTKLDEIEDFPYKQNLIGYWPNDREEDFGLNIIKDYSIYGSVYGGVNAGKSDMVFNGPAFYTFGSSVEQNICPGHDPSYFRTVFNTVDIPYQILLWMGVHVDNDWNWEGMGWPLKYRSVQN